MISERMPVMRICTESRGWKITLVFVLIAGCSAAADTISGAVRNQTTGKPAVGDTVILLRPAEGMREEAQTKSDAQGTFTFNVDATKNQRLVRVLHQGVNYDHTVMGTGPVQLTVFDAVPKIAGLKGGIGIVRVESDKTTLRVTEMYALTNSSTPPVTQSGPRNFEISTPPHSVLDFVQVMGPDASWVDVKPAQVQPGQYNIEFPIRPGDTLFKFAYHLPNTGPMALRLKLAYPIQRFAVLHPPSMSFKPLLAGAFAKPQLAAGVLIEEAVAHPLTGAVPVFEVSGTGAAPPPASGAKVLSPPVSIAPVAVNTSAAQSTKVPSAPPEVSKNVWWLLLPGIAVVLAVALFGVWRSGKRAPAAPVDKAAPRLSLLDALKEELFQLESDRLRGTISAEEYADAKQALNQSIQRAMARHGSQIRVLKREEA
jgi:hypothetical protein